MTTRAPQSIMPSCAESSNFLDSKGLSEGSEELGQPFNRNCRTELGLYASKYESDPLR